MDTCPIKCSHEGHWIPRVSVEKLPDGRYMLRLRLKCPDCNTWFDFQGIAPGLDYNGARCSFDRKELRIAISTPETLAEFYTKAIEQVTPKVTKIVEFPPTYERPPKPSIARGSHAQPLQSRIGVH